MVTKEQVEKFLRRINAYKSERTSAKAARKFILDHYSVGDAVPTVLIPIALKCVANPTNLLEKEVIGKVLRRYFFRSNPNSILGSLKRLKLDKVEWLPLDVSTPHSYRLCPTTGQAVKRSDVETLTEPQDLECGAVGLSHNYKKLMPVVRTSMNDGPIALRAALNVELKNSGSNACLAHTPGNPKWIFENVVLDAVRKVETDVARSLFVSHALRNDPRLYAHAPADMLTLAFEEPSAIEADQIWPVAQEIKNMYPVTHDVSYTREDWYAYCIRQHPELADHFLPKAQPAIVMQSESEALTFADLEMFAVFTYADKTEKQVVRAIKVGKRKAVIGIMLDAQNNICNLTTQRQREALSKITIPPDTKVRYIIAK